MKFNSGYCLKYRLKTEDTSASRGLEILQGKRNVKDSRALSDRTTKTAKEVSLCVRVEDKVSNRNQTPFTLTVFKHGHQRSHQVRLVEVGSDLNKYIHVFYHQLLQSEQRH